MADATDKIKLDDITFEDFIGDGIDTATEQEAVKEEVKTEEPKEETLDSDIEDKKEVEATPAVEEVAVSEPAPQEPAPPIEEKSSDSEETLVSEIATKFGYNLEGEYEDTSEGLIEMTKEIADKVANEQLDKLFESHPDVKAHLEYVMAGGDSRQFVNSTNNVKDIEALTVAEDNTAMQRALLGEYFKTKGHDDEFINELLTDYSDTGKLYNKSVKAQEALVKYYKSQNEIEAKAQKEKSTALEEKQKTFWTEIQTTINTNKEFSGVTIPEKEKNGFFTYISKPINQNGITQRDVDHTEASVDVKLAIDYLMYKGFKLDDIIKTKATTKITRDLKSRIKSNNKIKSANKGLGTSSAQGFDLDDLDLTI